MKKLILASSSQPRKNLLSRLQLPFEIAHPEIDETPLPSETPIQLVERLAIEKAKKIADGNPNSLVIGADQVGVLENQICGKPLTYANAVRQLQMASGKTIQFYIGLCLYDANAGRFQIAVEQYDVVYRSLTQTMIENYLQREQPLQCAGACKAEGLGIALIEEFRGKDFTALIGLPLIRLVHMLEQAGLNPLENFAAPNSI